jgi:acyl-CoA thioesterase I
MPKQLFLVVVLMMWSMFINAPALADDANSQKPGGPKILVLGDSLSAAYGIPSELGWVALLNNRLLPQPSGWIVHNASISGETTDGGLRALPGLLTKLKPAVVIIELGANDALRGFPLETTRQNLNQLVELSQKAGSRVLLVGMHIPPNYGPRYTQGFHALFQDVATAKKVPLVPFLLDGVATDASLMQDDRMHPNEKAQARLLENVWPGLAPLLIE